MQFIVQMLFALIISSILVFTSFAQSPPWQKNWDNGVAYYEFSKNYERAVDEFSTVIDISPKFWEAYFRRGLSYAHLNFFLEASIDFKKAGALNPALAKTLRAEMNKYRKQETLVHGIESIFYTSINSYDDALSSLQKSSEFKDLPESLLYLCRGLVNTQSQRNLVEGCKDCEAAANLGYSDIVSPVYVQYCTQGQSNSFSKKVVAHQFLPRLKNDSGVVEIAGIITGGAYSLVELEQYRNGVLQKKQSQLLTTTKKKGVPEAQYSLKTSIKSELAQYDFRVYLRAKQGASSPQDTLILKADSIVCGDVILCSGQSNMMLGNVPESPNAEYMRTFVYDIAGNNWKKSVETNTGGVQNGRVGGFAGELQKRLVEEYKRPICVINGAVGGTTIEEHLDFPRRLNQSMLQRLQRAKLREAASAVFWYQGESNTSAVNYNDHFEILLREWKEALPNLRTVYVAQIRSANCMPGTEYFAVREIQRRFQDKYPTVVSFATNAVPFYDGCHFQDSGYYALAGQAMKLYARDFYASTDTLNIVSPTIRKAYFSPKDSTELVVEFAPETTIFTPALPYKHDSTAFALHQTFTADILENGTIKRNERIFTDIQLAGNIVKLRLPRTMPLKSISYGNDTFYPSSNMIFKAPWLQNSRGVGAFSFYRFPVGSP
ncbi:MAG: hypothetical protein EAZ92_14720 [Candidatus Kapaibacterium sp.]|nr:MAG: hypothetical protein EAZ92_14720 [Candidatus Kapabacteria bacterium]